MLLFILSIVFTPLLFFILSHIPLFYKTFSIFPNQNAIFSYFSIFLSFQWFPRFFSISAGKIPPILFCLLLFHFDNLMTQSTISPTNRSISILFLFLSSHIHSFIFIKVYTIGIHYSFISSLFIFFSPF